MHAFGDLDYMMSTPSETKGCHKVQPRAFQAMFVGFEDAIGTKGWRMYCPANKKVYVSADVKFMGISIEVTRLCQRSTRSPLAQGVDGGADNGDDEPEVCIANTAVKVVKQDKDLSDVDVDTWDQYEQAVLGAAVPATDVFEPKTYKQAVGSKDSEEWRASMMRREVEAMSRHNVFKVIRITDLPPGLRCRASRAKGCWNFLSLSS